MPNSRICISIMAFLSGFMVIWLLISWMTLGPANAATIFSFRFIYLVGMFFLFVYSWIYFFRRPRGSRTLLDGRTALSGSAFMVGVATGYAFLEFGPVTSPAGGSFTVFVGCTILPVMAWLGFYIISMYRKHAKRREAQS